MAKMAVRVAHFAISIVCGVLIGYSFIYFRPKTSLYEAAGAGLLAAIVAMLLLPKLHQGGGGGGDF